MNRQRQVEELKINCTAGSRYDGAECGFAIKHFLELEQQYTVSQNKIPPAANTL
jgi:hypothetical protein